MRVKGKLVFVAAAAAVSSVWAADETWTGGAANNDWGTLGTPANWSGTPSRVPIANDFVIIPQGLSRYPVVSATVAANLAGIDMAAGSQLTLQSGRTLTILKQLRGALAGTILVKDNASLLLGTGTINWTNAGVLDFIAGGNFSPTGNLGYPRTLTNTGGTIEAGAGSTICMSFDTLVGGTADGAWRARSTNDNYALTFSGVTLGTSFAAVTDNSTYQANFVLQNSVTNNSTAFNFPTYGKMALASAGGTFTFAGTGSLTLAGQSLGGTGVSTIANNGSHTLAGYGTLNAATLTNAGTIHASGGTSGAPQTLNATAVTSTGAIAVDQYNTLSASGALLSDTGSTISMNGGTLSAGTLTNRGSMSGYGTTSALSSSGSIHATGGTAGATKTLATGALTSTGAIAVDQYNALNVTGTLLSDTGSTVAMNGGSLNATTFTLRGALSGYGTTGALSSSGSIHATGGTSGAPKSLSTGALSSTGAIAVDQYNTLNVGGTLLSDTGSTIAMSGGTLNASTFTLNGALSGYGTIGTVANSGSVRATGGTAVTGQTLYTGDISGSGTVTVDPYNTLQSTGTVTASAIAVYGTFITDACNVHVNTLNDSGVFHVEPGKSLVATGPVTSTAGSVFEANGTVTAPSVTIGGTLQGSGMVHSTVTLDGSSILSPGNSPGVLTVDSLTISDGAQYNFEPGDRMDVTGTLSFLPGAKMTLNIAPGMAYGYYTLMTANTVSGTPQFMLDGFAVVTSQEGNAIRALVPEPAILGMAGAVSFLALARRTRAAVRA